MAAVLPVLCFILLLVTPCMTYLQLVEPGYTTATSSSTYSGYPASRAVDGDISQEIGKCSHTADTGQTEAWLRIDLWKTFSIKSVKFWYRNDAMRTLRLPGYSIRVSNDTRLPPPESSCYTDPGNVTLPIVIEKDCERTARHVWFYQDKTRPLDNCPMLEICEVQVFGCESGHYGVNCTESCSHCKDNTSCGIVDGKCSTKGCALPGFQTPLCEDCKVGRYSGDCSQTCSEFCKNKFCDRATGACTDGCQIGYTGTHCNQTCDAGRYGQNCNEQCDNCLQKKCNRVNGTCEIGCIDGYTTALCKTPCESRRYGANCSETCGYCSRNLTCNHVNGACTDGCEDGYEKEPHCNQKCTSGKYGKNCSKTCGHCSDITCHHVDGTCPSGCVPGYTTTLCSKRCDSGKYGKDCSQNCSGNCLDNKSCDPVNGTCKACAAGFQGEKCDQSCPSGRYGNECSGNCSGNCLGNKPCDPVNGSCKACAAGFQGEKCNKECDSEKYGKNCSQNCSGNCLNKTTCDPVNGTCTACAAGFQGEKCDQNCKDGTYGFECKFKCSGNCHDKKTCNKENGTCLKCQPGWGNRFCSAMQLVEPGYTTATSSSTYPGYPASRTVDGDTSQQSGKCSHTADKGQTVAWLLVDLTKVFSIEVIKFWYRNDRGNYKSTIRLRGYSIRVSNDSVLPPPESSCYTDPGNVSLPTVIEKDCERTARYVWLYQNNTLDGDCPMLEICEVQVFGCDKRQSNGSCQKSCSHCKNNTTCSVASGKCNGEGCAQPGFQVPYCQSCVNGQYGDRCDQSCIGFCKNNSCDRTTGTCTLGCLRGYIGDYCNQTCMAGWYGNNCSKACGECFEGQCNHINGSCPNGCAAGYKTDLCNAGCGDGQYGRYCSYNCSGNCLHGEVCDKQHGSCQSCATGFQGQKCDKPCENGRYGMNCSEECGACLNNTDCNHVTGNCSSGCKQGWQPADKCDQGCIDGRYGNDCNKHCSEFCRNQTCEKITGKCNYGCQNGYTGGLCDKVCTTGLYGQDCSGKCGHCLENTCNHINGTCPSGCAPGYKTTFCNIECSNGTYGIDCRFICSGHCLHGEACDKQNGSCKSCANGFQGDKCNQTCENGKYGENCSEVCGACMNLTDCDHVTGSCSSRCKPGWQQTDKCDQACPPGTYGENCTNDCSDTCFDMTLCNTETGTCRKCQPGWRDSFCNKTCEHGSYGQDCRIPCGACAVSCLPTNGSCPGGCREGYAGEKCNVRHIEITLPHSNASETDSPNSVLAALFVVLVLLILLIVIILILFRRRFRKQEEEENIPLQNVAGNEDDTLTHSNSIKITDLHNTIKSLELDSNKGFQEEFQAIPYGEQPEIACTIGKLPENVPKNRFKTTFPYDHSRVVLLSSKNGDYINANYIKNPESEVVYIASQGPKANTVADFWSMVWQEEVFVIVMVTNLKEGKKIKCERYWPLSTTNELIKGNFVLQMTSEKTYANFKIHDLKIMNRQNNKTRHVTHLQYTSWPDHGTPTPLELLVFYRYVSRAMETYPENKLLVHCSAGIGRTGTFIALDALHRQGQRKGRINIVEYVHTMRADRMNMIQNASQYEFLHEVLLESFRTKCYFTSKENFIREVESTKNKALNLSRFKREFQELDSLRPVFEEDEIATAMSNLKLNMTPDVLPADKQRVMLTSYVAGRDTYYNAVPVATFTMSDCIIAAQYPVPGASVDLIRLLVDHDCTTLVSVNPLSDIPSSNEWFNNASLLGYRVEVKHAGNLSEHVSKTKLRIKPSSNENWHNVTVYEVTTWRLDEKVPRDINAVTNAVKVIPSADMIDADHKMIILSRDGATGCGVFCAVYNALQQLQQDGEVDIFTIVRLLQSRRPQMISDVNEYIFSCQVVAELIKSTSDDLYINSASASAYREENPYANT